MCLVEWRVVVTLLLPHKFQKKAVIFWTFFCVWQEILSGHFLVLRKYDLKT